MATEADSTKFASDKPLYSRKGRKLSSQALNYYLSVRPIYTRDQERSSGSVEICKTLDKKVSGKDGSNCSHGSDAKSIEAGKGGWTILQLPAVLGRRNLVEAWWSGCPSAGCEAEACCQTRPPRPHNLTLCDHCKPLFDARQVLALSKAMLYISHDGTVTVTARHSQLVHFDRANMSEETAVRKVQATSIGTLSIGMRPNNKKSSNRSSIERGLWMQFELQLQSNDQTPVDSKKSICPGKHTNCWRKVPETIRALNARTCGRSSAFFPSQKPRRRRVFLSRSDDSEDEEGEGRDLFSHEKNSHSTSPKRKLIFNTTMVSSTEGNDIRNTSINCATKQNLAKCGTLLRKSPPNLREKRPLISPGEKVEGIRTVFGNAPALKQPQPGTVVFQGANIPLDASNKTPTSKRQRGEIGVPRSITLQPQPSEFAHMVTPDHGEEREAGSHTVDHAGSTLCARRRLTNLENIQAIAVSTIEKKERKDKVDRQQIEPNDTSVPAANMLSMPDDRSKSDEEPSSSDHTMLKEVATQMASSPCGLAFGDEKLVKSMEVEDWKMIRSKSSTGSFCHALCSLVLVKNKHSIQTGRGIQWLPPMLHRNAKMNSVMNLR